VAAVVFVIGAGATGAHADAPALQINWSVGEGPVNQVLPAGVVNGDGSYHYEGEIVDNATGLVLTYDLSSGPGTSLYGNLSLENDLDEAIGVFASAIIPQTSPEPQGSLLAGACLVGLTTGPGGGRLSSLPPWLWLALVDGEAVGPTASLFADPFYVAHTGPASSAASSDFGSPDPVSGPPITESFGFAVNFSLTEFDVASITSSLATASQLSVCPGDINGDGEVGIEDLADMLAAWGACPPAPDPCPSDLDGDGLVGITDFLDLLTFWGPCP
jgi:hypothetical protein